MKKATLIMWTLIIAIVASMTAFIIAAGSSEWIHGGNASDNGVPFYAYAGVAYAIGILLYAGLYLILRFVIRKYLYKSLLPGLYFAVNLFFFAAFILLNAFALNLHI